MTDLASILAPVLAAAPAAAAESISIDALPFPAHVGSMFALVGGLLLWAFGRGVLRFFFIAVGTGAGATLGAFLPPALGIYIEPVWTVAAGGVIGFIASFIAFRFAIAATLAITLAIVAPIVASVAMSLHGPPPMVEGQEQVQEEAPSAADSYIDEIRERTESFERDLALVQEGASAASELTGDETAGAIEDTVEMIQRSAEKIRAFIDAQWESHGREWWGKQPGTAKFALVASVIGGALAGFALGLALPKRGAAIVTSFGGAAIWMPAAVWLVSATPIPLENALPAIPVAWLIAWVLISVLGTWIQWTRSKRQADKD